MFFVCFDNFIIAFLVLIMSGYITKVKIKKLNLLLACFVYVACAFILPLLNSSYGVLIFILRLLFSVLVCLLALDNLKLKSKFFLFYFCFITLSLITFAFCGMLAKLFGGNADLVTYNLDFPVAVILLAIFIYFKILSSFFGKLKHSYKIDDYIYAVTMEYKNKKIKLNAFLDTGNSLYDEKYNLPIAVVSFHYAQKFLTKYEALCLLLKKDCQSINGLHYINFATASSKNNVMPVFKLNKITLKQNNLVKELPCMIGVSFNKVSNSVNYDMLISLQMIE
ncbi:MAG: sigma-E processing peptidase SpoIIGA [Christensenellales bacterium]